MKQPCTIEQPTQMVLNQWHRSGLRFAGITIALLVVLLEGCASKPKDYWGSWRPINRYQQTPTSIPLNADYTYYATPMDGTLRTMLRRWAKDSGMQFSYQLQSDYTLTQASSTIRTTDIRRALADLNAIYAPLSIQLYVMNNEILAKPAADPAGPKPTTVGSAASSSVPEPTQSKLGPSDPAENRPTDSAQDFPSVPTRTTLATRTP